MKKLQTANKKLLKSQVNNKPSKLNYWAIYFQEAITMQVLFTADIHIKLGQKNVPVEWAKNRLSIS